MKKTAAVIFNDFIAACHDDLVVTFQLRFSLRG